MVYYNVFMKIKRILQEQIQNTLLPGKVIVLYGPRQVGKTTLANDMLENIERRTRFVNADELLYREALASQNRQTLDEVLADADLLIITLI
jgi:predicted AAA+ superfamily ATPase